MDLHVDRLGPRASPSTVPPLLLVHGLGGDRHTWRPVVDRLAAEREVLTVDLPGFGASPPLPVAVEPSPAALATALATRLDALDVPVAHVAGVSLGGWIALELADQGRAASVVALAPAGFWPRPLDPPRSELSRISRLADPALPLLLRSPRLRNAVLGRMMGGPGRYDYGDALALIRGYARATDLLRVNAAMRARTFDWPDRLGPIAARQPVHVLWGGQDPLVQAPHQPLPEAVHVHRLPASGHMPMFDDPDAVVDLLLRTSARDHRPTETPAEA